MKARILIAAAALALASAAPSSPLFLGDPNRSLPFLFGENGGSNSVPYMEVQTWIQHVNMFTS